MILWRLSGRQHAKAFDGGYGLLHDGRWNTAGHAITYCATSPSLCVLEKLVHIEDWRLLPPLVMVRYDVPDRLKIETVALADLPESWRLEEDWTQRRGDQWHERLATPLLRAPSVVVPLDGSPDVNVLINHRHRDVSDIAIVAAEPFALDARLLQSEARSVPLPQLAREGAPKGRMGCGKQVWIDAGSRCRACDAASVEAAGHTPSGAARHLPQQAGEGESPRLEMSRRTPTAPALCASAGCRGRRRRRSAGLRSPSARTS